MSLSCRNSLFIHLMAKQVNIYFILSKSVVRYGANVCVEVYMLKKLKILLMVLAAVAVLPMMLEVQTGLIAFEYGQKLLSLQGLVM
jgi:hypothetical protein